MEDQEWTVIQDLRQAHEILKQTGQKLFFFTNRAMLACQGKRKITTIEMVIKIWIYFSFGQPGLQGLKGDSGRDGLDGLSGLDGAKGDIGLTGFPGVKGGTEKNI